MAEADWDHIRRVAVAQVKPPADWPKGVLPISLDGTSLLGVDADKQRLFWDGKEIVTRSRLRLGSLELFLAAIAAAGIMMQGLPAFVQWIKPAIGN